MKIQAVFRLSSYSPPQETGFYYLQSRYYDPKICRFINADGLASTGQGFLGCNMFAYCNNNPILLTDTDGLSPAALWYYMFLSSEYGFIHKCVQAEIVASGVDQFAMEKAIVRADGSEGRVDIVSYTGDVWEIKHMNSTDPSLSIIYAEKQALSYVGAYCSYISGDIRSLGPAGYFSGTFVVNCMGTSYEIMYCTPSNGVILYSVNALEEFQNNPDYVFTPKEKRRLSAKQKRALVNVVGASAICSVGGFICGIIFSSSAKQVSELHG